MIISQTIIPSPVGDLIALASEIHLLMLEFADSKQFEKKASVIAKNFSIPVEHELEIQKRNKDSSL